MVTTTTSTQTNSSDIVNDSMNEVFSVEMDMFESDVMDFTVSGHETLIDSDVFSQLITTTTH